VETDAFDYALPRDAIAQQPADARDGSRLLVDRGPGLEPDDRLVTDLPELLGPGDLLVVNETRVRRSRLALRKATGGAAEVLLLERRPDGWWEALVRPSRRLPPGTVLTGDDERDEGSLVVEVGDDLGGGRRRVRFPTLDGEADEEAAILAAGELPMPPYVTRRLRDPERYQTVYAAVTSSAAAPTAGLHLTDDLLARCRTRGVEVATVELAIGLDTFRPITTEKVGDHRMHSERYHVPASTLEACARAERVVAVGTTAVRALESSAATGEPAGRTELFIRRGFEFQVVDVLLTNFHLPRSTLLVLIDAFVGPHWRELYEHALAHGYRFLSFGDAMFIERAGRSS
jgi:S-adenosylmethionine:tRNA ribosyltransferase-isomerase